MSTGDGPKVVALELRSAFHQPGCPICRVKEQSAYRYLFGLLWENVNNMGIRLHLVDSLGFCPEHTWHLWCLASAEFGGEVGTHILYEAVVRNVAGRLCRLQAHLPDRVSTPWWLRGWMRLRAALGIPRRKDLMPTRRCPACECVSDAEERNMHWLIEGCGDAAFWASYAASDGLCLTHLRQAVEGSLWTNSRAARLLTELAVQRLQVLDGDLNGHIRKRAWECRHETMTDGEQSSAHRAAQFLGGQDPCSGRTEAHSQKPEYLPSRFYRQMGLRVDE